jgi:hypothetical protein
MGTVLSRWPSAKAHGFGLFVIVDFRVFCPAGAKGGYSILWIRAAF